MHAAVIVEHNQPLQWREVPDPTVGPDEVLIRVHTVSVNRSLDVEVHDLGAGWGVKLPHWTGADPAGVVVACGSRIEAFSPGDRVVAHPMLLDGTCPQCVLGQDNICRHFGVVGVHRPGGDAELIALPAINVIPLPDEVSFEAASAAVLTYGVSWEMVFDLARLGPADTVLVWGASGGVGSAELDWARLAGSRVIAVVSNEAGRRLAEARGAKWVVNRLFEPVADAVMDITHGRGVDAVLENIGATTWPVSLKVLAPEGRLVTCGSALGGNLVEVDIRALYRKHVSLHLTSGFHRRTTARVIQMLAEGRIAPAIGYRTGISDAERAQQMLRDNAVTGKVILTAAN